MLRNGRTYIKNLAVLIGVLETLDQVKIPNFHFYSPSQPAFTCSKLAIETLEQGVKYVKS